MVFTGISKSMTVFHSTATLMPLGRHFVDCGERNFRAHTSLPCCRQSIHPGYLASIFHAHLIICAYLIAVRTEGVITASQLCFRNIIKLETDSSNDGCALF